MFLFIRKVSCAKGRLCAGIALTLGLTAAVAPAIAADTATVSVPIELRYPLMRKLLVEQLFTGTGQSRQVLKDKSSCNLIVLTEPQIGGKADELQIQAQMRAKLGVNVLGYCFSILNWQGQMGFLGHPVLQDGATSISLQPRDIWLVKADGERLTSGRVWNFVEEPLQGMFADFSINLTPFTGALEGLLPEVLPSHTAPQLQAMLDSVKLSSVQVTRSGVKASIDFVVDAAARSLPAEDVLSPEELAQWQVRWQMMDALLVVAVKHYASATHLEALRSTLLDILIDSRYQLVAALSEPANKYDDVVRTWFLQSWQRLRPVVHSIAMEQNTRDPLMWFSVLTATDALYALDQLGPQVGLEISADGLRRLARMINREVDAGDLEYDEAVDPELQELFQEQLQLNLSPSASFKIEFSLFPRAYAASPGDSLDGWVPQGEEIREYLPRVETLLAASADNILKKHRLDASYHQLYRQLVLATAWQESCWRQYVIKDDRIEPLTSSTGDVGIMQMNERVWRGFYDLQKLRWDISYNTLSGAEVLLDYLGKYAIRRGEHKQPGGIDNLARSSYSAYNGGPSKASRYRTQNVPAYFRKVDSAFWKKYQRIVAGGHEGVAQCLGAVI